MTLPKILQRGASAAMAGLGLSTLALTTWFWAASPARAETIRFKADLTGAGEFPPSDSKGTGHCDATLEADSNVLNWQCTYSGVSGPLIGAHFDGPVSYRGATSDGQAPIQVGTAGELTSPLKGTAKIDANQAHDLRQGLWYFDLHTKKFPAGEIRGPVVKQ
jgi:hypothetical protein